jgi:methylenetetrahydrofolate reductase (NADPH)
MSSPPCPNLVRDGLAAGRFVLTIEVAAPNAAEPFEKAIRPVLALAREIRSDARIDAIAVTDRSLTDDDHHPLFVGHRVAEESGKVPIVHWAGKDRTAAHLDHDLQLAEAWGLQNLLLVTGDKLRTPPAHRTVRYLDSVHALSAARQRSAAFLLAAAVSPFKYREEELVGQYLKALKKLRAGADLLMTQIGWDLRKHEEVRRFLAGHGYRSPLVAEVLLLTPARGDYLRRIGLAGVILTDDLAQRLMEDAAAADGGRASALRRLALQIVNVRDLGYAGAQVSGIRSYPTIARLLDEIEVVSRAYPTPEARAAVWRELLTLSDGRPVRVAPAAGYYLTPPVIAGRPEETAPAHSTRGGEWAIFRAMDLIDKVFFKEGAIGARALGSVLHRLDTRAKPGGLLAQFERALKGPLLGCQTCGFCRLPQTAYVCPETCPKGLANGPCGGTKDNVCEFGDRECIHNRIYRISNRAGSTSDLEETVIPPVPEEARGTCSWIIHFQGKGPRADRLPPFRPESGDRQPGSHDG